MSLRGLADRGSPESGEYALPLGEEAWLAALPVADALETVPGFCRGAAVEVLVRSDVVEPEAEGVDFVLEALRLGLPRTQIGEPRQREFFEGGEEALDSPVLPGAVRGAALVVDADQEEDGAEEERAEIGLVVGGCLVARRATGLGTDADVYHAD